jgi:hypothetical protein
MDPTLKADGFESAFLGTIDRCGQPTIFVYDYSLAVRLLMTRDKMSMDEAMEYLEFNVVGAWVGAGTPAFLKRCRLSDAEKQFYGEDFEEEDVHDE